MKTKYFLFFLLVGGIMITTSNCKKNPVDQLSLLPPITDTGANTFGCLINGVAMTPKAGVTGLGYFGFSGPPLSVEFRSQVRINVGQSIDATHGISMTFYLYNLFTTGSARYDWAQTQFGGESFPLYNSSLWGDFLNYKTNQYDRCGSYNSSGMTNVSKFDTVKRILSGTFSGKLSPNQNGGDTVNITNGRFDIKW